MGKEIGLVGAFFEGSGKSGVFTRALVAVAAIEEDADIHHAGFLLAITFDEVLQIIVGHPM